MHLDMMWHLHVRMIHNCHFVICCPQMIKLGEDVRVDDLPVALDYNSPVFQISDKGNGEVTDSPPPSLLPNPHFHPSIFKTCLYVLPHVFFAKLMARPDIWMFKAVKWLQLITSNQSKYNLLKKCCLLVRTCQYETCRTWLLVVSIYIDIWLFFVLLLSL